MAVKYYAVRKGIKPGIYKDWNTCKAMVTGFSGAQYKSFTTLQEAEAYIKEDAETVTIHIPEDNCTTNDISGIIDMIYAYYL